MSTFTGYNQQMAEVAAQVERERQEKVAKQNADTERLKAKIDSIGMKAFTEIFLEAHEGDKFIVNPEEFLFQQPDEVKNGFYEIYYRELKLFHKRMLEQAMPTFNSQGVAKVMITLAGTDIPMSKIEMYLDGAIALKKQ